MRKFLTLKILGPAFINCFIMLTYFYLATRALNLLQEHTDYINYSLVNYISLVENDKHNKAITESNSILTSIWFKTNFMVDFHMMLSKIYKTYLISVSKAIVKFLEIIWFFELWKSVSLFRIAQCVEITSPESVGKI